MVTAQMTSLVAGRATIILSSGSGISIVLVRQIRLMLMSANGGRFVLRITQTMKGH